jgi:membrane-anchored protein YejM (alkaline phosphatase superfamily)
MANSSSLHQVQLPAQPPRRWASENSSLLIRYAMVSYLAVLINAAAYLRFIEFKGAITWLFAIAVYLSYSAIYMLPMLLPVFFLDWILGVRPLQGILGDSNRRMLIVTLAVLGTTLLQVVLYADRFIFNLYGFHLNGFVWNLVFTRGGLDSLGGSEATTRSFAMIVGFLLLVQVLLMIIVIGVPRVRMTLERLCTNRRLAIAATLLICTTVFERVTYGVCTLRGYRPVLAASNSFPFYLPTRITNLARRLGYDTVKSDSLNLDNAAAQSVYPRNPIRRDASVKPPNIVWLTCESLRGDMVDKEIMPNTWALAQKAIWCRNHYSGGNGTRMGMFSMFYGLYGCFWFPLFEQQRAPVLMDVLQQAGYQLDMFTSASFTYPEFDRTIFVNVPPEKLHEGQTPIPWRRDEENVTDLLKFIETRDSSKPFMTFMFFESPHAHYHFPVEAAIRKPYAQDVNYATMDLKKDIDLIKNRYVNACHYADSQFGRVLIFLEQQHLMESTVVIVTGDHGEEFMEKGHWGHNNDFTEEQTKPAMVMWVPGRGHAEFNHMTSHLDIPATLMKLLGVTNPLSDYTLGIDLLGEDRRDFTVICDWNHVAYVDANYKIVLPFNVFGFAEDKMTTSQDGPVKDVAAFNADQPRRLTRLMTDIKSFSK